MQKRLKITLVLLPISACLIVGVYVYSLWAAERQRAAETPVEAADTMARDLLSFHKKRGGFPKSLKELEGVVWEQKQSRSYSNDASGLMHRNYFYLYSRKTDHLLNLWAIPVGKHREDASTWFLVVTPEQVRRWKGGALSTEDVKSLKLDPSANELSLLGLVEQQNFKNRKD